jgi:hypothetical protein
MATFAGPYIQFSANGNVIAFPCSLMGIFVSAASGTPTITVYDDAATGTTTKIVDTFTPAAATWYPMPFQVKKGVNIVIGGTVSGTVSFC